MNDMIWIYIGACPWPVQNKGKNHVYCHSDDAV